MILKIDEKMLMVVSASKFQRKWKSEKKKAFVIKNESKNVPESFVFVKQGT